MFLYFVQFMYSRNFIRPYGVGAYRVAQLVRKCATRKKVMGSIPDRVIYDSSLTQPLPEISASVIS